MRMITFATNASEEDEKNKSERLMVRKIKRENTDAWR